MKKLVLFVIALVSFSAMAYGQNQDANPYGHRYYNDHSNYRMYGANVLPRTDHTNLDTLTSIIKGDIRYDTINQVVVYYDGTTWVDLAASGSGGNTLDEAYDQGGKGEGREIVADSGAVYISGEDGFIVTGEFGSGDTSQWAGAGTGMFFNPKKAAFRAGYVDGTQWDNASIGDYSVSFGSSNESSGDYSLSHGENSLATNEYSVAIGAECEASGAGSVAMGSTNISSGDYSATFGEQTQATGNNSFAVGGSSISSGNMSFSSGESSLSKSYGETAIGIYNTDYTPTSTTAWEATDRLFVIGNGQISGTRSNALTMLKNGNTGLGTDTPDTTLHVVGQIKYVDGNEGENLYLTSDADGNATWTHTFSYGEMGFGDSTSTIALTLNTPAWVTNGNNDLWSEGAITLEGITYSNDSLICNADGVYEVNLRISGDLALNDVLKVGIYKNGSLSCTCQGQITSPLLGTVEITYVDILPLSADDVLQVYITNTANSNDFDAISANMTMHKVGN